MEEACPPVGQQVQQVAIANLADAIRIYADRLSTGENKARPTSYTVHTQRDDERRHTQPGNDQAIYQAVDEADGHASQDYNEQRRTAPHTAHDQGGCD